MKRRDFLSRTEQRALDLLERSLLGEGFRVYANVPLRKVIEPEPDDALNLDEERMLRLGELDFVVTDRDEGFAVRFAIEYDSAYHEKPARAAKDRTKDRLCYRAGIPLIRIREEAIGEREQVTVLEWILDCFRLLRTERERVDLMLHYFADRAREDPDYRAADLGIAVHTLNPFPASLRVRERLATRYGIASPPARGDPWDSDGEQVRDHFDRLRSYLEADLSLWDLNHLGQEDEDEDEDDDDDDDDEEDAAVERFRQRALAALDPSRRDQTYSIGVKRGGSSELLHIAEVPIYWSPQPIVSQAQAAERIGSWMWAVDIALAEYRALSDVERWAARNLVRADR